MIPLIGTTQYLNFFLHFEDTRLIPVEIEANRIPPSLAREKVVAQKRDPLIDEITRTYERG